MEMTGPDAQDDLASAGETVPSINIGGLRIDTLSLSDAVDVLVGPNRPGTVHLCNAYTVSLASQDGRYRDALNRGALNLADGMPVVWVARRRGHSHLVERPAGPDLMERCLDAGRAVGLRHFLYGSTPEVLEALSVQIEGRWPGVALAGLESPPFRELSEEEVRDAAQRAGDAGADVIWVGLGTPKQDYEVERLGAYSNATCVAIGAAFDFLGRTKKRAPRWMQRVGLEWLFRLVSEPRRLWRRYLVGNVRFLATVIRDNHE